MWRNVMIIYSSTLLYVMFQRYRECTDILHLLLDSMEVSLVSCRAYRFEHNPPPPLSFFFSRVNTGVHRPLDRSLKCVPGNSDQPMRH